MWTVNIADFLMVVDILDDPASFHHYARARAEVVAEGIQVIMESDALGAYLIDRFRGLRAQSAADSAAVLMLGYHSEAINAYFTAAELGLTAVKPSIGVPVPVTSSLAAALTQGARPWTPVVDAVMGADADLWRRWRSYYKRHRKGGRFLLDASVRLLLSDAGDIQLAIVTADNGLVDLRVAPRAAPPPRGAR